jgi:predicted CXXCH cytochrome family protein
VRFSSHIALLLALAAAEPRAHADAPSGGSAPQARRGEAPEPAPALRAASDASNTCASCHATLSEPRLRAPVKEYRGSVHRDDRVGCVGCHKGDPRDPTVGAHARSTGFTPRPTNAEVPGICGGCHSDASFMRHMNARLPVGQAALFGLSLHGKLTAAGDPQAPSCASCHGKHEVLPPSSPRSPVNRANIAKLCGGCHADPARMGKHTLPTDQVAKWEKSVHGQAFLKGNPSAPTCTGCHGAHAATPPEASSVARACGRCHEDEMKYFEQSPHAKSFRKRGLAECAACHGNHDVAPPTALLVGTTPDASCMKCHSQDDKPRKVAEETAGLLRGARARADEARVAVARAREAGLHVAGASFALDRVATAELELRGVVHTLDPTRLEGPIAAVDLAVAEARGLVAEAERVRKLERRGYYVALALAGLLFVSLGLKSRELDRRR